MDARAVKERPILFSAPMVRAILEGRKTQTRRALKPTMPLADVIPADGEDAGRVWYGARQVPLKEKGDAYLFRCRYGVPGDRLWVRETFAKLDFPDKVVYRADGDLKVIRWTPAIHMPRKLSRVTLEVTGVRVERLKDISEEDARAEGAYQRDGGWWQFSDDEDFTQGEGDAKWAYSNLWDRINGPGSWEANPWVWVVEFKRIG